MHDAECHPEPAENILLADEPAALRGLQAILGGPGRHLVCAASLESAMSLLAGHDYAVAVLGVPASGRAVFEAARGLRRRQHPRATPLIFLADQAGTDFPLVEAYRLGAVDYLAWPVPPEILRAKVDGFVELARQARQLRRQEELSHRGARELADRRALLQHAVAGLLGEEGDLAAAIPEVLRLAGECLCWDAGAVWTIDHEAGFLRCTAFWSNSAIDATGFETDSRRRTLRRGEGLPGRVWDSGAPVWLEDLAREVNFPRMASALKADLRGGCALPIRVAQEAVGVLEFFGRSSGPRDENALAALAAVGSQVGQSLERRRAEEALRATEQRFALFMQYLPGLAWIKDLEGRYVYANDAAQKAFRASPEQLYGRTDTEVFPPETAALFRENDRRVLCDGTGIQTIETLEHEDGILHHSVVSKFPLPGTTGRPVLLGGVAVDITDRRRAEEQVRETAERLGLALAAADLGDWSWDAASDVVTFSERAAEIFGIPPGPHMTWSEMQLLLHEEDRERARLGVERAIAERTRYDVEYRVNRQAGGQCWVSAKGRAGDDAAGVVQGMYGVVQDITERRRAEQARRESEERFRAIVATTPECVKLVAADGTLLDMNAAGLAAIEADGLESVVGKCIYEVIAPEHRNAFREFNERVCRGEAGSLEFEIVGLRGTRRHMETHSAPLRAAGALPVHLGVTRDITVRKRLEQDLRDRAERLAEADRRKDEFLAILGHELRNPLAPLRNAIEILKLQGQLTLTSRPLYEMMQRQVSTLMRLTDDLLDVSRVTKGTIRLHREVLDLGRVVALAAETSRPLLEERGHRLTVSVPPEMLCVDADPVRLEQVLTNLLNNAAKYTETGGTVWLEATCDGSEAVVRVRDTGIGIRAEAMPLLFEPFHQADRLPGRVQEGLGIGLSLVRGLVELHGGTVVACSDGSGRGSEFTVRLPLAAVQVPEPVPAVTGASTGAAGSGCRILVVDDNEDAAWSLAALLRTGGHEVACAHDGPEALETAASLGPNVVFLDIGMPGMDGYEVCRRLRRQETLKGALLVALTGYGQEEDMRRAREAGFDHHLVKPADPEVLQDLLARRRPH